MNMKLLFLLPRVLDVEVCQTVYRSKIERIGTIRMVCTPALHNHMNRAKNHRLL